KTWLNKLRDRQTGADKDSPPYLAWARQALKRKAVEDAAEFFERPLQAPPSDVEVLSECAGYLAKNKHEDRASKLLGVALSVLDTAPTPDKKRIDEVEAQMRAIDPSYARLDEVRTALIHDATALIERYLAAELNLEAM